MNKTTKIVFTIALVGIAAFLIFKKPAVVDPPKEVK